MEKYLTELGKERFEAARQNGLLQWYDPPMGNIIIPQEDANAVGHRLMAYMSETHTAITEFPDYDEHDNLIPSYLIADTDTIKFEVLHGCKPNKEEFIKKYLEPMLVAMGTGVAYLEWLEEPEIIVIHYDSGATEAVNVAMDSHYSIVKDVFKQAHSLV